MRQKVSRRAALKTTGSLGIGLATGSILATSAAASEEFEQQLKTTRLTTQKYRSLQTARDNGYEFVGIFDFVGVVFLNPDNIGNLDQSKDPSVLFYAPVTGADLEDEDDVTDANTELAGIEYHAPGRPEDPDEDMYADEESSRNFKVSEAEGWHNNPDENVNLHGLHVWAHLENPNGLFALVHATIHDRLSG